MDVVEQKIYSKKVKTIIIAILFALISGASFALGYIYATQIEPIPIIIEKNSN